ncbi:coiled-coil domain-containing protein 173 isoform X2 [Tachyglossus aculeatus]|uniref:coiled-coil domain-containing protein 173 isoform X1 n=1 Tax=Tachyglossus aculeatus TaxID=9261 RepID=UPI0018F6D142|nr:coiled-coil domain-containing protein 173 isoform X1 [Tachyglossus aculeatus]XP_038607421.1 coiled-coil domain-containing protein 173 isoform X2 [Tachyglossus aculeatus]
MDTESARREPKGAPGTESLSEDRPRSGYLLPPGVELHQVTILPKNEWERIHDSLNGLAKKAARLRAERKAKKDVHLRSQAIVKTWTNTCAGMKEQKLQAERLRKEKENKRNQEIDLEEEHYRAEERKKAIDRARLYQYYQMDRVKGFHSALLLTEVLKERDAQIGFKKKKLSSDKKWEEQLKHNVEKALQEEQQKAEKCRRARLALANDHLQQIKEHEEVEELRRQEEQKDAEEIKKQTKLYELERQKENERKEEEMLELQKAYHAHIENRNILRQIQAQQEAEENEKLRDYVNARKCLSNLRREKELETHRQMEEQRSRITSLLHEMTKQKFEDEDARIARDTAEVEAEKEKEEKEKEEKTKAELQSIAKYRTTVMKNKEEKEKQDRLEAKEKLRAILEADQIYIAHEKEKRRRGHEECKRLQQFQIQQMAERKANLQQERQADLDYVKQTEALAARKEKRFQEYAKQIIDFESKTTQKLYPLYKASQKGVGGGRGPVYKERGEIRPSYQAKDFHGTQLPLYSSQAATRGDFQKSKRRLGFTW